MDKSVKMFQLYVYELIVYFAHTCNKGYCFWENVKIVLFLFKNNLFVIPHPCHNNYNVTSKHAQITNLQCHFNKMLHPLTVKKLKANSRRWSSSKFMLLRNTYYLGGLEPCTLDVARGGVPWWSSVLLLLVMGTPLLGGVSWKVKSSRLLSTNIAQ